MRIDYKVLNKTLYIALSGELDEHTAFGVRSKLDEIIDGTGFSKVVFELSELGFMDSTGIGVLIGRYKRLKARQLAAFVASPSKQVDKLLTLSGIYEIMPRISY